MHNIHRQIVYSIFIGLWASFLSIYRGMATTQRNKVFLMEIKATIDPRMNRYVTLALEEAAQVGADQIIIEMDTYGGAVIDADAIRARLLAYEKPISVFINKNAASAGALISIACDSIYMAPGASIGAATVVTPDGQAAPDKYQSFMRSMMRATAEAQQRNPQIAEAMVDESIEIEGITRSNEVITFTTHEAIKHGFCEGEVNTIDDILAKIGVENYNLVSFRLSKTEKIIAFFLNPLVSGLLILIIIGGIYFELQTPGVGFPLIASCIALALYFIPHYLNGLVGNLEIVLFLLGLGLIALELFVIPGFGITGIAGIILTVGALVMTMLHNDVWDFTFVLLEDIVQAVTVVISALAGAIVLIFIVGARFTRSRFFKNIALQEAQKASEGYTANFQTTSLVGKQGVAYTKLRPSGKIMIEGEVYDAHTGGNYLEKGTPIIVISVTGTSFTVKAAHEENL
ncbi:MAG: nodulation protein NfeD [Cytophagales bacterium]|nr:nodulation protein NfeD [Cytophagales bacterium]